MKLLCWLFRHQPVWYYDGSGFCRRCKKSGSRTTVGQQGNGFDYV